MTKSLRILTISLSFLCAGAPGRLALGQDSLTGNLSGTYQLADGSVCLIFPEEQIGNQVPASLVMVNDQSGKNLASALLRRASRFRFTNLPYGVLQVQVNCGSEITSREITIAQDETEIQIISTNHSPTIQRQTILVNGYPANIQGEHDGFGRLVLHLKANDILDFSADAQDLDGDPIGFFWEINPIAGTAVQQSNTSSIHWAVPPDAPFLQEGFSPPYFSYVHVFDGRGGASQGLGIVLSK